MALAVFITLYDMYVPVLSHRAARWRVRVRETRIMQIGNFLEARSNNIRKLIPNFNHD